VLCFKSLEVLCAFSLEETLAGGVFFMNDESASGLVAFKPFFPFAFLEEKRRLLHTLHLRLLEEFNKVHFEQAHSEVSESGVGMV
jgi:hypothetical protein